MHSLVNDLLDLTRLEQRRIQLEVTELDLREVVRELVEVTKPLFESRKQSVAVRLPENHCLVKATAAGWSRS